MGDIAQSQLSIGSKAIDPGTSRQDSDGKSTIEAEFLNEIAHLQNHREGDILGAIREDQEYGSLKW